VFEIPDAELAHADVHEVAAYLRVKAPLAGPRQREASKRLMAAGGRDESLPSYCLHASATPRDFPCGSRKEGARGATEMPIRRYLGEGGVFTPKTISEMSRALEAATRILGIEGDENQRQIVARFIIQLSREDDSLDSAALGERVFAALGGVAFCDVHASPQRREAAE
jgi:hypothetical protein